MPRERVAAPSRTTALLRQQIRTVFRHYPKAIAGDEEAVHQVRVAGRRLRVALPLLARKPKGRRVRRAGRALREMIATAGGGRDLDVILDLFEKQTRKTASRAELKEVRRRLQAARSRSRGRLADALLDFEVADLRHDLRRIQARGAENLFAALSRIRRTRETEARALETAVQELERRFDPEALHKIRIRARRLRYVAEVDAAIKDIPSEAPARFKQLQSHLGRIQDAHVLSKWLEALAKRCQSRGPAGLAAEARRRQAQFVALTRQYNREKSLTELVRRALDSLRRRDSDVA